MATAQPPAEAEAKPKSKKGLLLIVLGVVGIVVLVVAVMIGTLAATGQLSKPAPAAEDAAEGAPDGHGAPEKKDDGHGAPAKKDDGHGAPAKTDAHGAPIKGDAKEAGTGKLSKKSPDSTKFEYSYFQVERDFLVNLSGSKKVMSVQIAIMTRYDDRVVTNVKKHEFALRSVVMDAMRLTTEAEVVKPDFRKDLAIKLRDTMNTLLEKYEDFGGIEEIYFTSFIVQ